MAGLREGGKVDGSGTRRSWPFIQAQWSLAGPQGDGTPLWIVGGHEAAPCRSDVICITFRALHGYFSHTTTRMREHNGSTSFEAEPIDPSRCHRQTQEAIVHLPCFHGRFSLQSTRCGNRAYLEKPESRQGGEYATI
jgi:hypothetical protein